MKTTDDGHGRSIYYFVVAMAVLEDDFSMHEASTRTIVSNCEKEKSLVGSLEFIWVALCLENHDFCCWKFGLDDIKYYL